MNDVDDRWAVTFCRFCIANCGMLVRTAGDRVVEIKGDPDHPLSHGYLCPKGRLVGEHHDGDDRLDRATLRTRPVGGDAGQTQHPAPEVVVDDLVRRLRSVRAAHGPDAVGVYVGTHAVMDRAGGTAALAVAGRLGTRSLYTPQSIDNVAKYVATQLVAGRPRLALQIDPAAELFVFVGCNPVVAHGHTWAMPDPVRTIRGFRSHGEVWVADPRVTETARLADRHLRVRPDSDYALWAFVVRELLAEGADHAYLARHAVRVDELARAVEPFDATTAAARTGLPVGELQDLVAAIRRAGRCSIVTGTGSLFSPTAVLTEWLVLAALVVTGSIDRPGGMWCSTGFFDVMPHAAAPAPSPRVPGGPPSRPDLPGWLGQRPCGAMADEIEAGNLRALLIFGGNPLVAFPDHERIARALASLEVLVVADVVESELTSIATHVLPSLAQLERADLSFDVTAPIPFVQYTGPLLPPHPGRRPMWWYANRIASEVPDDAVGEPVRVASDDDALVAAFPPAAPWMDRLRQAPQGVMGELPVFGHALDGLVLDLAPPELLHRLAAVLARATAPAELVMISRRQLRHMNSTLDTTGPRVDPDGVFLSPGDAAAAAVAEGDVVRVSSASGWLDGPVRLDPTLPEGVAAVPHGFANCNVTRLTSGAAGHADPLTGMVYQTAIPITVERAPLSVGEVT